MRRIDRNYENAKDTGLAITLALLIMAYFFYSKYLILLAIIVLVVTMITPSIFKPLALVWFGLSRILGDIVSRIVLSMIFMVIVIPIGFMLRISGKDSMQFGAWKNSDRSFFVETGKIFNREDLENPY